MDANCLSKRISKVEERINELEKLLSLELETLKTLLGSSLEIESINSKAVEIDEYVDLDTYIDIRDKIADKNFSEKVKYTIKDLPTSNGSGYFEQLNINIGVVMDEFLYHSYQNTANLIYVTPKNYKEVEKKVDFLLIVSAWKGLSGEWVGLGNPRNKKIRKKMFEVINYFKLKNKKTVFYSKEDPTNYEYFIEIAKKCDFIFTTAIEKIPDYKKDCKTKNVFLLEFGVNPIFNNPIAINKKRVESDVLFAGSWYKKYPKRQKDTRMIFDGVLTAGKSLKIIDRNYDRKSENYLFPIKYLKYVSPSIDHNTLQLISKLFTWCINLNSIQDSMTMFASRIFELQSMGNLVLSNYSLGVNNLFPTVFIIFDSNEVNYILNSYEELELYQLQMFGVRKVLREHTTFQRLSSMLTKIGYEVPEFPEKRVAVIYEELTEKTLDNFRRQTYKNKSLLTIDELKDKYEHFDYVTFFSDEYIYEEFYLEDMVNGFKYTDSAFITKDSYYNGLEKVSGIENDYTNEINDYRRTVFSTLYFSFEDIKNIKEIKVFKKGYSIDSLELNLKETPIISSSDQYKFSVIIPVYNNGDHLYGKCFMSLRRSSMFKNMEIIIVDDGSTDDYTPLIVKRLERLYPNVKTYFYKDGGSGSASRPRNKGIELATTKYVTFLDPDNEAVNDGYAKLYKTIIDSQVDVVVGNIIKADTKEHLVNYFQAVKEKFPNKDIFYSYDSYELLIETSFKAQSIQAMMFKKEFLINKNIKMIVGALGEDTLFFFEALLNASSFKVINETIHIYYAGVEGSLVNNISSNTFKKYLILEKEKLSFLKNNYLLKAYMELRFNYYFKNWYLKKLKLVEEGERLDAERTLFEIYQLYKEYTPNHLDDEIKAFIKKFEGLYSI